MLVAAVPTLASFILFNAALQRAPASLVNLLVGAELGFTALFAAVLFHDSFLANFQPPGKPRRIPESALTHGLPSRTVKADKSIQTGAMNQPLFLLPGAAKRDPAIEQWLAGHTDELGVLARKWFEVMRRCGPDVREILHDGHPTACVGEAAFAYVNAFKAHVNVGFFHGAGLPDPMHLLEGTGKHMRHVKLVPGLEPDAKALTQLIAAAYADMRRCAQAESPHTRQ